MNIVKPAFLIIEAFAFILPAIPGDMWVRLVILLIYFVAHYNKLQYEYVKIKKDIIVQFEQKNENMIWLDQKDDCV